MSEPKKLTDREHQGLEEVCEICHDLITKFLSDLGREDLTAVIKVVKIKERGEG
jgi:hypothetical protein